MLGFVVVVLALCASSTRAMVVPDFGADFTPSKLENMNGEYVFSTTPGGRPGLMPKNYRDYPGGVESFDLYSPPITTLYSQVWWSPLEPVPLPAGVVSRYAGKGMAIVGWEIDQVQRTPQGDISVPISASYNHHYVSCLIGSKAAFRKVKVDGPDSELGAKLLKRSHGNVNWDQEQYIIEELEESPIPTHQWFSSANGGEYRKTYHGFPPGYALVVDSPTAFQLTPMQIDTWNRDEMNITSQTPPKFVPGPMPRASQAPADAEYSGLLECPVTTRVVKQVDGTYTVTSQGTCAQPIMTPAECYLAAATIFSAADGFHRFINATGMDTAQPAGCSVSVDVSDESMMTLRVFFNAAHESQLFPHCGSKALLVSGRTESLVNVSVALNATSELAEITLQGPANVWYGAAFGAKAMADQPWTLVIDVS